MSDDQSKKVATDKLASEVPAIMQTGAHHVRKMASALVKVANRAAVAEKELLAMKLARRMEQRGMDMALTFDEKVAKLRDLADAKLAQLSDAVELAAGGVSLGTMGERVDQSKVAKGEIYASDGSDLLDDFVLSNQGGMS